MLNVVPVRDKEISPTDDLVPVTDVSGQPPCKINWREIGCVASEKMNVVPVVECSRSDVPLPLRPKPTSMRCAEVRKRLEFSPTVSCLYFQEDLLLKAQGMGLTVSAKSLKLKRRKKASSSLPLTFAHASWFYEMKEQRSKNGRKPFRQSGQNQLLPSRRLLLSAHQSAALKVKKLTEMYEVEYIADFKMMQGERYYLVKWAGWPEEASTWESFRNLSCHLLIKEFHQDFQKQLMIFFEANKTSWSKVLFGMNGLHKMTYTQRLYDALPKGFKYKSSYGELKTDFRAALKKWQDVINFCSKGKPYIAVENEVDLELPPENFTYISHNVPGKGVTIPNDPLVGCECTGECDLANGCSCAMSGKQKVIYVDGLIKIRPGRPIYECNSRCKCSSKCPNRVVQKGSKYTLGIFRTSNGKGWGVKALQHIPKGAFVVEYVGEVITNSEAEERGLEYDSDGITYLFDLDYHETETPMTVDATRFGNISHFINHSCSPNLQVYNVFIDNMDLSLPRIALFARKEIRINEELSFDYQMTGALGEGNQDGQRECSEDNHDGHREGGENSIERYEEFLDVVGDESEPPKTERPDSSDRMSEVSDSSKVSSVLKVKCLCNSVNCRGWLIV